MIGYFRCREALPSSRRWVVVKTLFHMVVFWVTFLGIIPYLIYTLETALGLDWWRFDGLVYTWVGIAIFAVNGLLGIHTALTMALVGLGTPLPVDCARQLVLVGAYRYVRNPMAIAGLSKALAVGVMVGSPSVMIYAVIGGPIWHALVRPREEADLERRFGEAYRRYRQAVWLWLPRARGYRVGE